MQSVLASKSIDELNALLEHVRGKLCWQVSTWAFESLQLDFGKRFKLPLPPSAKKSVLEVGEWVFNSWGTDFEVKQGDIMILKSHDEWRSELERLHILIGAHITTIHASTNFGLEIAFSNNCILSVLPTFEDALVDVPFWEIYNQPDDKIVQAGPDIWSYRTFKDKRFE